MWHPHAAQQGTAVQALTQTVDLYATVLDLLDVPLPTTSNIHSRSFAPVLLGQRDTHRDHVVYGYNNQSIGVTSGDWTLLRDHDGHGAQPYAYTHQVDQVLNRSLWMRKERPAMYPQLEAGYFLPGVDMRVWKTPTSVDQPRVPRTARPDLLFNNASNSMQEHNVAPERADVVSRLALILQKHSEAIGAPVEQRLRLKIEE